MEPAELRRRLYDLVEMGGTVTTMDREIKIETMVNDLELDIIEAIGQGYQNGADDCEVCPVCLQFCPDCGTDLLQ